MAIFFASFIDIFGNEHELFEYFMRRFFGVKK